MQVNFSKVLISLFCLAATFNPQRAFAAEEQPVKLGDVVVTATRHRTPVEEIPASVIVVTREQIKESSGFKLDHVLRKYAGIDVNRSSFLTHSADVVMRGMGEMPGRTLILFDGVPMNKADTGAANWDLYLPDNVERIEIIKGPVSALYGSSGMGGVINIISRQPAEKPVSAEARGTYGSFNTWKAGATVSGEVEGFGYYLAYDHVDSDGYNPVPEDLRTEYNIKRYLQEDHVKAKASYKLPNDSKITLGYLFFDDERGEGTKIRHEDGVYRKWKTNAVNLDYEWKLFGADWLIKGFYNKEDYFWNRESISSNRYTWYEVNVDRIDYGGSLQTTFPILSFNLVTVGLDYKHGSVDGNDSDIIRNNRPSSTIVHNEGKQNTYSVFMNDHIKPFNDVILDVGIRYDYVKSYDGKFSDSSGFLGSKTYEDKTWDHVSPRIAALYKPTDSTEIKGSVGTAFRAPILDDLYRSGILRGRIYAANPELGPEKVISYEAGVTQRVMKSITLGVSGYLTKGTDFFYPIKVGIDPGTGRDLYQRKNLAEVAIYGVELDAGWDISNLFSMFANYTYNISKIDEFDEQPQLEGKYFEGVPRHKANVGVIFKHPDILRAEFVGRFVGKRYGDTENTQANELDEYVVFDLKLSRGVTKYAEIYLDIINLFDKDIKYATDFEGPGIEIMGGLTLRY